MAINFASTVNFQIQTTEVFTIDGSGRFLTPFQPAFNVMSAHAAGVGNVVPAGTQQFNIGSFYNSANGRFTAPIAGIYFVRFQQLAQNASTGEFRTAIYRNDAAYSGYRFISHKAGAGWRSLIAEAIVQMSANDYVTVRYESGPAVLYTDANYATFSGHLIG
jgi:hypothetical protein